MSREWMDVSNFSFNTLLLLEQVQLGWLSGWLPERELQITLRANPVVEWYLRHKCPHLNEWLDNLRGTARESKKEILENDPVRQMTPNTPRLA